MSPPQTHKRLCISLAYASLETEHASLEIYPEAAAGALAFHAICFFV